MSEDHLILDKDVPVERARLNLGTNPLDNSGLSEFTLEADLERLSKLMKEDKDYRREKNDIRRRMKQAEEDKDKLSERGRVAYEYMRSRKDDWV
jgi:hypothetical protein